MLFNLVQCCQIQGAKLFVTGQFRIPVQIISILKYIICRRDFPILWETKSCNFDNSSATIHSGIASFQSKIYINLHTFAELSA